MKESDFVRIINNSIKAAGGFSYKIPDTPFIPNNPMRFTGKKPFDIISVFNDTVWIIEAKYSRGIKGFNEKILKPHQKEALELINNNRLRRLYSVMIYGCYLPREIKRIYIFHITLFQAGFRKTKKELLQLPYLQIKKNLFNAKKMEEYIIK